MYTHVLKNEKVGGKNIAEVLIENKINPSLVMVRVNGAVIFRDQYEFFIVPEGAEVKVYPFVGGG